MVRIPSPVEGIAIGRDPREDAWHLTYGDVVYRLRPWMWGDRRRILECATAGGVFDRNTFIAALLETLLEPAPQLADTTDLACVCLYLLKSEGVMRLGRAEYLAVTTFGWRPSDLDAQPAAAVDR